MASPLGHIKALTFDVFGTVVDWRSSVESALTEAFRQKAASSSAAVQERAKSLAREDIARFAQEWRNAYGLFTKSFVPGQTPWKDIDTHHYDSLLEQLERWNLAGVFSQEEARALSLVWHRLTPWKDSAEGLGRLGTRLVTATLSNGNRSLLQDLDSFGSLGFAEIISAEDFKAYKPNPATYLGAADRIGVKPTEVAMVAAHLGDLQSARSNGLHTIYVERPEEEAWAKDSQQYKDAQSWVDIWVGQDEDGFREVARRLGL